MIDAWHDRAIELVEQDNFRKHPVTVRLAQEAKDQIKLIEIRLLADEEMSELQRRGLIKEKKVHQMYLSLFETDPTEELQDISNKVNDELNS